ncbi:MAG: glycosyltransferase family 1 protein [Lachnospiraceae bacterium]|nr:glycosyltransferase family 1 protein [Lachnospiraceae bacterium]
MKITAVSVGTRGDVQPLIELGVELRGRGHDFRVAALEKFRPLAEEKHVPFLHLDGDADRVMQLLVTDYVTSADFMNGCKTLYRETPRFMDTLMEAIEGSDLVLYGILSGFARHVCDYYGIPCARYFYSPFDRTNLYSLYTVKHDHPLVGMSYAMIEPGMNLLTCQLVNNWRKEHGLKKWRMTDDYRVQNGKKVLTFYPVTPLFMPPDSKWEEHIHVTGYWYHPQADAADYVPAPELERFLTAAKNDAEKPIFICFGKAQSPELAKLQRLTLEALRETKLRAIVQADQITKEEQTALTNHSNDSQLYFVDNIPYSWIFPRVKAVVHHGGNTTNGLGIRAGCPTLVIPLALDQYFYGRTIHENGCGPAPLYIRKKLCSKAQLKSALLDLASGRYDRRAGELSALLRRENGCKDAADIIEHFLASYSASSL